ncbi:MAG TPA: hypothetical protein VEB64_00905, partial [Azospirillaceae bacterium]|nr:hypothetical protein [Azospirillaceae bacterium]
RVAAFAALFAVPAAVWLVSKVWRRADELSALLGRVGCKLGVALVVTPFPWMVLTPSPADTASKPEMARCDLRPLSAAVGLPPDDRPRLIVSFIDLGPEILLRTRDAVLTAPYHRNSDGIRAAMELFLADDDARAAAIARDRDAAFILMCRNAVEFGRVTRPSEATFAGRLAAGRMPEWLEAVPVAEAPELLLFRVVEPRP